MILHLSIHLQLLVYNVIYISINKLVGFVNTSNVLADNCGCKLDLGTQLLLLVVINDDFIVVLISTYSH